MAEIFGTAAAALSVATLFNNCVDCFNYIQLGRHLGGDFDRCQLKPNVAQLRLSRWGQVARIYSPPNASDLPDISSSQLALRDPVALSGASLQLARKILLEIGNLFQEAIKTTSRYHT
jgi:hypothetical protein